MLASSRTPVLPLGLLLVGLVGLVACEEPLVEPELDEDVHLVLSTSLCEPEVEPQSHFFLKADGGFETSWETLCVRDGGEVNWYALKVSYWEDRAEDAWNVWLIDPSIESVIYGDPSIPAVLDPNIVNEAHPNALERVAPAPLVAGDYRVEVWAVVDDYLDSQRSEVRLTLLD